MQREIAQYNQQIKEGLLERIENQKSKTDSSRDIIDSMKQIEDDSMDTLNLFAKKNKKEEELESFNASILKST